MAGISTKALGFGNPGNKLKYNGKEEQRKEFSDGGGLEWFDYGARMYDNQIGRWMVQDLLSESYYSSNPYAYVSNDPVNLIDPNGMEIVGVDGQAVSYTKNEDGSISWVNATEAVKIIGEAMLMTPTGTESFDNWIKLDTKVNLELTDQQLKDENGNPENAYGKTNVLDENGNSVPTDQQYDKKYQNDKGEFKAIKVTISTFTEKGDRYNGAPQSEMINAVGAHEEIHSRKAQIAIEKKPLVARQSVFGPWHESAFRQELMSRLEYNNLYPNSSMPSSQYTSQYVKYTTLSPKDLKKIQNQANENTSKFKKVGN